MKENQDVEVYPLSSLAPSTPPRVLRASAEETPGESLSIPTRTPTLTPIGYTPMSPTTVVSSIVSPISGHPKGTVPPAPLCFQLRRPGPPQDGIYTASYQKMVSIDIFYIYIHISIFLISYLFVIISYFIYRFYSFTITHIIDL